MIFPVIIYDIGVLAVLMCAYLMNIVKSIFMEYYKVKQSVISENAFRDQVNQDMASMKSDVASIKLSSTGIPGLGGRR